ncbi:hypothetical protein HMPREF1370_03259 [Enterococcus faecium P1123]|nr:hypothetical protein HMPREF1371_02804 [Enterococcus faecium P1137]EJX74604.1 hypothetical protein HMPREF1370_03259 [Enterococcus faecium P1123]EJX95625.1 hypothetical protein HMPREF1364_02536 [Enterococcus faecium ERV165]MBK4868058.1 hypothetical protein [Enterococcus faecium]
MILSKDIFIVEAIDQLERKTCSSLSLVYRVWMKQWIILS